MMLTTSRLPQSPSSSQPSSPHPSLAAPSPPVRTSSIIKILKIVKIYQNLSWGYFVLKANLSWGYYVLEAYLSWGYFVLEANLSWGYLVLEANLSWGYFVLEANLSWGYFVQDPIGCCTRFSCTLIKWYTKLAKIKIPTIIHLNPNPLLLDERTNQYLRFIFES